MGHGAVVDILAQMIAVVVFYIHEHLHAVNTALVLVDNVHHTAGDLIAAPIVIIQKELAQSRKKGGDNAEWRGGGRHRRQIQKLRHPHVQYSGNIVQCGQVNGNLPGFIFGYA